MPPGSVVRVGCYWDAQMSYNCYPDGQPPPTPQWNMDPNKPPIQVKKPGFELEVFEVWANFTILPTLTLY